MGILYFILQVLLLIEINKSFLNPYNKKAFQAGILLWFVAALVKIMHWPGANLLFIAAVLVIFSSKALSLTNKKPGWVDCVILLWIGVEGFYRLVQVMHLVYISETVSTILFAVQVLLLIAALAGARRENLNRVYV